MNACTFTTNKMSTIKKKKKHDRRRVQFHFFVKGKAEKTEFWLHLDEGTNRIIQQT